MTKRRKITLPRSVRRLFPQVKSAFDATSPVEVSVNRKDCKGATSMNPMECALARAAKRELNADGVIIGMSSSYIIRGTEALRFATPDSVQREIVSFDRHHDFAPGEYHLTTKAPTARFGAGHSGHKHTRKTSKRKVHLSARVRVLERGASSDA